MYNEAHPTTQKDQSSPQHDEPTGERKFFVLFASVLFGALILGFIISSGLIFTGSSVWLKILTGMSIAYDLLTSFIGNLELIYAGEVVGGLGWPVLLGLTLFVSGSSLILALLSKRVNLKVFSSLIV